MYTYISWTLYCIVCHLENLSDCPVSLAALWTKGFYCSLHWCSHWCTHFQEYSGKHFPRIKCFLHKTVYPMSLTKLSDYFVNHCLGFELKYRLLPSAVCTKIVHKFSWFQPLKECTISKRSSVINQIRIWVCNINIYFSRDVGISFTYPESKQNHRGSRISPQCWARDANRPVWFHLSSLWSWSFV